MRSGMGRRVGVVRPDGSFDVPSVSPGNHILMANRMTREQGRSVGLLHVQVGASEIDDVVLRMAAPAQMTGTTKAVDNPSVRMCWIRWIVSPSTCIRAGASPKGTRSRSVIDTAKVPGGCLWRARWLLSAVRASLRARRYEFWHDDHGSVAGLEFSLAKGAMNVEGSVSDADGKAAGQTSIALVPLPDNAISGDCSRRPWPTRMAGFVFRNLSPGEYTRLAFGSRRLIRVS